jgi:inorganic phosphate transporter, PiT family
MTLILLLVVLLVALGNGANDTFKGFATVWSSQTLHYRSALYLACAATAAGGIASWLLAQGIVAQFSGKGLVDATTLESPHFVLSVAVGTALTLCIATARGLPVSTTHALIGGLLGAGAAMGSVDFMRLGSIFLLPLLLSPLLAAFIVFSVGRLAGARVAQDACLCIVATAESVPQHGVAAMGATNSAQLVMATQAQCDAAPVKWQLTAAAATRYAHIASACSICFARAANDAPKLAGLLLIAPLLAPQHALVLIAIAMTLGGLLFSQRVARSMSHNIVRLEPTQGLAANVVTASLVLLASVMSLPVSTTHVSVGAIVGAGAGAGVSTLNWHTLRNMVLSWVATLPMAAAAAWLCAKFV